MTLRTIKKKSSSPWLGTLVTELLFEITGRKHKTKIILPHSEDFHFWVLPTSGGRSVGIVRSRTQASEFSFSTFVVVSIDIFSSGHLMNLN
jgi:hypothetical protein